MLPVVKAPLPSLPGRCQGIPVSPPAGRGQGEGPGDRRRRRGDSPSPSSQPSPRKRGEGTTCGALNCNDTALSDFRKDIVAARRRFGLAPRRNPSFSCQRGGHSGARRRPALCRESGRRMERQRARRVVCLARSRERRWPRASAESRTDGAKLGADPPRRSLMRVQRVDSRRTPVHPTGAPNEQGADLYSQRQGGIEQRG